MASVHSGTHAYTLIIHCIEFRGVGLIGAHENQILPIQLATMLRENGQQNVINFKNIMKHLLNILNNVSHLSHNSLQI